MCATKFCSSFILVPYGKYRNKIALLNLDVDIWALVMQTNIFLLYGRGLRVFQCEYHFFFVRNNDNWGPFTKNVIERDCIFFEIDILEVG